MNFSQLKHAAEHDPEQFNTEIFACIGQVCHLLAQGCCAQDNSLRAAVGCLYTTACSVDLTATCSVFSKAIQCCCCVCQAASQLLGGRS